MTYVDAFVLWFVLAAVACAVIGGWALCRTSAQADLNRPLHPQRLALVKKAQQEIAWTKTHGRQQ